LGVLRLGVFGSVARGEQRADSDLDLLVELDRKTFDRYMDLKVFLEDILSAHVDLVLHDRLRPELKERILAELVDAA
jgi:predicted nucleotidyltransferase